MTVRSKATLKGYFNSGDTPVEANFSDLIDTIPARYFGYLVAANNAPADVKSQADYVCDGAADDVEIQAAIDALANGGTLILSQGAFSLADTLTLGANVRIIGQGRPTMIYSTGTMAMLVMALGSGVEHLTVVIPNGMLDHAIKSEGVKDDVLNYHGWYLKDLLVRGGNAADYYALHISDSFDFLLENLVLTLGTNGVFIENIDDVYNYGNSLVNLLEIRVPSNRTGLKITGTATKNFNLMQFNYLAVTSGSNVGNVAIDIDNGNFITFVNADIEGVAVGIDLKACQNVVFINPYVNPCSVAIAADAYNTLFMGGRLYGTITDACVTAGRTTSYFGTGGPTGARLA
jgi:hypothetical protein